MKVSIWTCRKGSAVIVCSALAIELLPALPTPLSRTILASCQDAAALLEALPVAHHDAGAADALQFLADDVGVGAVVDADAHRIDAAPPDRRAHAADDRLIAGEQGRKPASQPLPLTDRRAAAEIAGHLDAPRLDVDRRHRHGCAT